MKNKRQTRKNSLITFLVRLLLFSLILNIAALVYLAVMRHQTQELEDTVTAALEQADASNQLSQQYADRVNELIEQNNALQDVIATQLEVLSTYDNAFVVESPTPPRQINCPLDAELQSYIWVLCNNYGIADNYELVYAIIQKESNFNHSVVSRSNDYGLMQINIVNHTTLRERLGITDFLDPYQNVHGGIYLLSSLLHKYDVADALMAYNMGERGASKHWVQGVHSSSYSETVLEYYTQFREDI